MIVVRKKIVTDEESQQPVAVMIDYEDWLEIERLLNGQLEKPRHIDLSRFRGTLKLTEDPLEYQRRIRDEWER